MGYPPTAVSCPPTAVGGPPTAVGYPPTAVGYPPTAVGYPPTVVGYPPTAITNSISTVGSPPWLPSNCRWHPPPAVGYLHPPSVILQLPPVTLQPPLVGLPVPSNCGPNINEPATRRPESPPLPFESKNVSGFVQGVRVRVGFHAGTPMVRESPITGRTDYFGRDVNYAARVSSAGTGGQIITSSATVRELLQCCAPHDDAEPLFGLDPSWARLDASQPPPFGMEVGRQYPLPGLECSLEYLGRVVLRGIRNDQYGECLYQVALPQPQAGNRLKGGRYPPPPNTPALTLPQRHSHTPTPAPTAFPTARNRPPPQPLSHPPRPLCNRSGTAPMAPPPRQAKPCPPPPP